MTDNFNLVTRLATDTVMPFQLAILDDCIRILFHKSGYKVATFINMFKYTQLLAGVV